MKDVRDRVAGLDGWTDIGQGFWKHRANRVRVSFHPIDDTLDACAAAWDRHAGGLVLCMHVAYLTARERNGKGVKAIKRTGHDAASELRDRWALLGEVLKARGV